MARKTTTTEADTTRRMELEYHQLEQASREAGVHSLSQGRDWHGGLDTQEKVWSTLHTGSTYMLDESQKLLDKIHDTLDLSGITRETEMSVVGACPSVPAFLAGEPACMRRVVETEDQGTPVRVFFGLVSSGGISAEDLALRSAAILAFAQALSLRKPVELIGVVAMRVGWGGDFDTCIQIRIGMAPLDMSAMCALAHPGVQRGALYGMCEKLAGAQGHDNSLLWPKTAEAVLVGCQPGDVFFKSPYYDDVAEIKKDPIAWVQTQLEKALKGDGAAYTGHANDR
jgi:hypothetical protein